MSENSDNFTATDDTGTNTKNTTPATNGDKNDNSSTAPSTTSTTSKSQNQADPNAPKMVALTFDDGPYSPVTNRILDTLEKHGAKATFFVVGDRVATYESSVKRAGSLGCEIGSHTWSHKILTNLSSSEITQEINKADSAITSATGKKTTILRPPGGSVNDTVRSTVPYPLIMWDVDSEDWKNRNSQTSYDNIMDTVSDGSIILMHDLYPSTADAVERLVPDLISRGYKLVTVSELMAAKGINCENGQKYFSGK